ncbi:MAG: Trm112 family protein [Gemmatimonadota bacterium]
MDRVLRRERFGTDTGRYMYRMMLTCRALYATCAGVGGTTVGGGSVQALARVPDLITHPIYGTATMLDPDLLEILVCPETKEPVALADDKLLERLNTAIGEGRVKTRGGESVEEPLESGLVREDGGVLYPVRDDIPIMLIDEAIPLDSI